MRYNPDIRRIMLIFPPCTQAADFEPMVTVPMGIAYLAATVREAGYEVRCLDALVEAPYHVTTVTRGVARRGLTYEQIIERVKQEKPDLVGISCIFSNQWPSVRELAQRIKALDPDLIVCTGGAHPTFLSEYCMNDAPVDFIFKGEAEDSFIELLSRLREGRSVDDVDGLVWRDDDTIRANPKTRFIEDLDRIPFPAHDLFNIDSYFKVAMPMGFDFRDPRTMPLVTSRGCPCQCRFCSSHHLWGRRYRTRSAQNVLEELDWLVDRFRIGDVKIHDDNLTISRKRAIEIFNGMIERPYQISWNMPNGVAVWTLDRELLALMKRSGCFQITMALESGDQHVLNNIIKKPLKLDKVREVNRAARDVGIERFAYFMIGLPGETREQIMNTFQFSRELKLENSVIFIYNPLPGSELFGECIERGYITDESFFEGGNVYFSSVIDSEHWTAQELARLIRYEYLRNYLAVFRSPRLVGRRYLNAIRHRPSVLTFTGSRVVGTIRSYFREKLSPSAPPEVG
jgi:magnesium-protoporphyrin IX monomethyl ester (oxidative) cyclase